MLRDRDAPMNLFAYLPTVSMQMDPGRTQMATLLDDDMLFPAVKAALSKRCPHPASDGRPSPPVEVMLRLLVVKPLSGWRCPQTPHCVSDSLVLRQFCRISVASVPDQSTLHRWAQWLQPATRHRVLAPSVHLAWHLQGPPGRTLRRDGTVVAPNIHPPTDSPLLNDGVRVLSRALGQATPRRPEGAAVAPQAAPACARQARDKRKRMMEVARQRGEAAAERLNTTYRDLIDLTTTVVARATHLQERLTAQAPATAQRAVRPREQCLPLGEPGIAQTPRRVLGGEHVPASDQLVRLFEPDTARIRPGKPGKPTAFGRGLWLAEGEGGIIRHDAVLDGHPDEKAHRPPSLDQHRHPCGHPPDLLPGDRGRHSGANERDAARRGGPAVVLPKPGTQPANRHAYDRQEWLRAGRHGRAGIEGRISGLKRRHGRARCRDHGPAGMERWVGLGVLAQNLHGIAQHLTAGPKHTEA